MGIMSSAVGMYMQTAVVAAAQTAEETERLFGLDYQTLFDTAFTMVNVLILYVFLKYVLFIPVRKLLEERKKRLDDQNARAAADTAEAQKLKAEYEQRILEAGREADNILGESRREMIKKEQEVLDDAKTRAADIMSAARSEASKDFEAAQSSVRDEVKDIASAMAARVTNQKVDRPVDDALLNEALKEAGGRV
ncbi:MAG TPA: ATP synthase F0 subunit B [Bacteroides sp.]|nr:aTP synthase subunit b 3 [Bacteroides pectinophilus CAG:437]HBH92540.1 ATP synthase F0 subunit B [Bacteroides sp.]